MKLQLNWKNDNEDYILGELEKSQNEYIFRINIDGLKRAIKKGCVGIGNFDLKSEEYRSKELFSFFKNRIPDENNLNIKRTLEELNMIQYDEMELLKYTGAELATDNYYMVEL